MSASAPQSRILTLVFTDVAGSTLVKTQIVFGGMAPDVDRRISVALHKAGFE